MQFVACCDLCPTVALQHGVTCCQCEAMPDLSKSFIDLIITTIVGKLWALLPCTKQ